MNTHPLPRLAILRILDANLDRAREGLRIIEEWGRFALEDSQLTENCKQMRQELAKWHTNELRLARDTPNDPGTELSHPQEETRNQIEQVLQANLCRVQEALRVLEEYGKLYHPDLGNACKHLRYQVYILESNLLQNHRASAFKNARLYLVTSPSENLFSTVEAALQGGLPLVQYRDKEADDLTRLENAQKLCQLCHRYGALFLMNDRVDLAVAVNADGVHLGQQDIPIAIAKQLLGPNRIVGRSTTNSQEMAKALTEGADYIGVGPVYATPTKAGKAAAGLEYIEYAAQNASIPWFAIGGIDASNIEKVVEAGAQRVAVVRAIMQAENPTVIVQELLEKLKNSPNI